MSLHPPVSKSGMLPLRMLGLLLLSLLPYGADLICTPIRDSLILNVPMMIENGTEISGNCSTTDEDFKEMSLCLGNTCCAKLQNDTIVSCVALVSDFSLTAKCKIKLNDTFECSTEHVINVYKNPEVMFSVKTGDAKQADYELHCDVFNDAPTQNFSVTWYKNNKIFVIEPFMGSLGKQENISYTLAVNISREEKFAEFRCEAQLKLGQQKTQHPVTSITRNVSTRYAPELRTNSSTTITVPKGGDATLLCDVDGNPPPEYQWTVDEQPMLETTNRLEIIQVNSSSNYRCTATNILGNTTMEVNVDVQEEDTTDPPAMPTPEEKAPENCGLTLTPSDVYVKYGDAASIDCKTTSKNVGLMNWETAVGNVFGSAPTITWRIEKLQDFTVEPFCFVTLYDNTQCTKRPKITLYKPPDLMAVSAVGNGSMREGEKHQLQCDIYGVSPASKLWVKWYKDNKAVLTANIKSFAVTPLPECLNDSAVRLCNVSSVYTFTVEKSDHGALFRCEAEFQFGPAGPLVSPYKALEPYTAAVHYKPTIKNCPSYAGGENKFCLHDLPCETDGNPPPDIKWYYNGTLIDSFKLLNRAESGTYKATVYNSMGQVDVDVNITVEYVPSFSCKMLYEVKVNDTQKPLCKPEGSPSPVISWFKNGKEISPQRWKKHESGNYSLKASNKHGTAEHMFYLDILYPPEFTESVTTKESIFDGNVSLVWKADGNPKPEIKCNYPFAENVEATTVGRQKIITITGATSTNAGSYICVATNKVGSVTRTTTLVLNDKTADHFQYWWILLLVLLLFLAMLALVVVLKDRKKHGQYNFVANNFSLETKTTVENGAELANGES